jgi:hypothetical protein
MLYQVVKKLWAEFFPPEFPTFLIVPQQPSELRQNGGYGWIQRVK